MGEFITKVKVRCDYDNSIDKNFVFTILAKNKADVIKTVNEGLLQKIEEGEMSGQNLRSITVQSDDERGFFSTIVGDINDLIKKV